MIRFIFPVLLVFSISVALSSCTSISDGEGVEDEMGPIEEDVDAVIEGDAGLEGDTASAEETPSDEELAGIEEGLSEETDEALSGEGETEEQLAGSTENEEFDDELESELEQGEEGAQTDEIVAADETDEIDALEEDLGDEDLIEEPVAAEPPIESQPATEPVPAPVPAQPEKARVNNIRYVSNSSGGTVVIETSSPVTYQTRMNSATQQFVIELADVELPPELQKPTVLKDFKSRIGSINAYQSQGSSTARVVIQLSGAASGPPVVQQEGASLVVIPPAAPVVAKGSPSEPAARPGTSTSGEKESALSARTLDEFLTGNQNFYGRKISLQVKDADVRDVVNFLAEESGANIVMSDDVGGKISLKVRRVPWDQALVTVMRSKGLGYVRQGNVLRISTLKALQAETEAANKIIEAQKAIVPDVVQVLPISYASLDDLTKNIAPFLSKEGKVVADNRTSTLVVTDKQEAVDRVAKLVKTLDIPPGQVSIESKIVEAVEDFESRIGVNWSFTGAPVSLSPSGGHEGAPLDMRLDMGSSPVTTELAQGATFAGRLSVGVLDVFGDLTALLSLAERDSLAKVISAPRISTMNREKSTITQQGENISVISTFSQETKTTTKSEKRTPYKVELAVTPQITADGAVIMDLDVQREFLGPEVDPDLGARPVNKRSAKTKILVRNGQTAVIGGIYTSDETESTRGIPGLMKIPVLGWLFKSKGTERIKNELLIFMTPRILASETLAAQASVHQ